MTDANMNASAETVTNPSGTPDYSSIPEEVIKSHPLYKQVLSESIERRKEIAELRKNTATTSPTQEATAPKPTDPMQEALARIASLEKQIETDRMNSLRERVAREAGIPLPFANRIVGTTYDEMLADAQIIAAALPKQEQGASAPPAVPPTTPGNAASAERDKTMLNKITQRMGTTFGVSSPFDVGLQRQLGGGIISKEE